MIYGHTWGDALWTAAGHTSGPLEGLKIRAGASSNVRGGGHNLPPALVWIGLTDIPKSVGPEAPLAPRLR